MNHDHQKEHREHGESSSDDVKGKANNPLPTLGESLSDITLPIVDKQLELQDKRFYVTTPIYYPNSVPHIGHAYTTIMADVLNRYNKLFGKETYFTTGTDEHGQKVQEAAREAGVTPQELVDDISTRFQETWREFSVEPDLFMRTTFDFHKQFVEKCLQKLFDSGDIYKGSHTGWYSVSEEIFWPEKDIVDGKSPTGKEVIQVTEENYFFRMSKFCDRLVEHIEQNPGFISPPQKESETLGFLRQNVTDLCIGRPKSRVDWGIELPFDKDYVAYVWFDALLNYVSSLDKGNIEEGSRFDKFWDNATHLIGKDILITHTVYFPTMLMALDIQLPKTIFAHGWWLNSEGRKMSKSEGEVVAPLNMKETFGEDGFRYYMSRGLRFGNDLAFDIEKAKSKVNEDLANNFGNLVSRAVKLSAKTFGGAAPAPAVSMESTKN